MPCLQGSIKPQTSNLSWSSWVALLIQAFSTLSLSSILIPLSELEIFGVITLIDLVLFILILVCEGYLPATSTPIGRLADLRIAYSQIDDSRTYSLFYSYTIWNLSTISAIFETRPLRIFIVAVQRPCLFIQIDTVRGLVGCTIYCLSATKKERREKENYKQLTSKIYRHQPGTPTISQPISECLYISTTVYRPNRDITPSL